VKLANKRRLSAIINDRTGIAVDPESLFDIQVKRLHEYKRQHLNVLHILTLYRRLKANPNADIVPRTFIFGGKAGIGDHLTIGEGARVAGGAGVLADIPPGETWSGYPAKPIRQSLREAVWLAKQATGKARS